MTPPELPEDLLSGPKHALRQAMRARLAAIDRHDLQRYSAQACEHALTHEAMASARVVMVYLPIAHEVDVRPLARVLLDRGVTVSAPRVDWGAGRMAPVRIGSLEEGFEVRRHGVPEPIEGEFLEPVTLDVVITPGLAFDAQGGRLGRGAGFYDRFFTEISRERTALIGVGLEAQIVPATPMGEQDVRLHAIATETALHLATNLQ